ncbi:MAG: hypothetical protein HY363_05370 [Candidatus Aenigmarchaeota archaeon]|nr:hypothetical protein [Candidatus Aenigmarchaeota archaeon]
MKTLLCQMVVKHIRVQAETKQKVLRMLDKQRQQKNEFILTMTLFGIVVIVAIIGLLAM